ncbi:antibiotic biosynthesis monooxygenase [Amycolatopsis roodepoortensis]|uniref:Quinol monooxygenase YgiN n=1 Tax=Amycolatopsis roodepoortensis TaxID=700274 RepID=A0ABR9L6Q9_9PSEU|nr:antibiotic biosynthesis monooxygenase family protein [Amycolatopsis roodepoortensis]MBE1576305.1 quinol monooxygenase YgiN [Amycolatopsis roodepoortensis]UUV29046.1 antibiotic biosynthesis monooxygenase [Amycolatopsis roodepoortensis]
MIIVAGYFQIDAADRDKYVKLHEDVISRARKFEGCLDFAITADAVDPERVNLFERWESDEVLNSWRAVANPPEQFTEIKGGDLAKFEIASVGSPY